MANRRARWLVPLAAVGLISLVAAGVGLRLAAQRAEQRRLREAEVGRAPVSAPRRTPTRSVVTAAVAQPTACITGLVTDHGAPVAGMLVSASDAPPGPSPDCPCVKRSQTCTCREGLELLTTVPRAALVEAVLSATTTADGRFSLCGLDGAGLRVVWAEHADGRLAFPADSSNGLVAPASVVELKTVRRFPVSGLVLKDDAPLANATVLAISTPAVFQQQATSTAQGRFQLSLPQGVSTFVVWAPGVSPQLVLAEFEPARPLVLTLRSLAEASVRAVFDERPVAGAEVSVNGEVAGLTDARGVLSLKGLPTELRATVRVTKGDLLAETTVTPLEGAPRRIDVRLERGVQLRGVVTDEQGTPKRARVRGVARQSTTVETDDQGRFEGPLRRADEVLYPVAFTPGCAESKFQSVTLEQQARPLTLQLRCAQSVNGVVLDAEGQPIADASVVLLSPDHQETTTTDAAGVFAFHQPPGLYQLKVSHDRYRDQERPLPVPAKDVTVVLDAGGSISGEVVDGHGAPVANAEVRVVPALLEDFMHEMQNGHARTTTDADGHFEVSGLLAGRLAASASADSQGTVVSEVVVLQPGEHREGLTLTLDAPVDVRGVVRDPQRRPIARARVIWEPVDEKAAFTGLVLDAMRGGVDKVLAFLPTESSTNVEGRFEVRALPVSQVRLTASAPGYAAVDQLASKGDVLELTLAREGGRARGRVVDETFHPLLRFDVDGSSFTPDDGRFEVQTVSNDARLTVSARGFTTTRVQVKSTGPSTDVGDVVLKKGLRVTVEVKTSEGAPLEGVFVSGTQADESDSCHTNAEGRCVLEPLLSVQTKLEARKDNYSPLSKVVEAEGLGIPVKLTLAAAKGRLVGDAFVLPGKAAVARNLNVSGAVSASVMTGSDGTFTAEGLPEGPYCVSLSTTATDDFEWASPAMAGAAPARVSVGPAANGAVLEGVRPVPGRLVLVQGAAPPLAMADVQNRTASALCTELKAQVIVATSMGRYRLEGVPAGRWSVYFGPMTEEGGTVSPTFIELLPNETKTLKESPLTP